MKCAACFLCGIVVGIAAVLGLLLTYGSEQDADAHFIGLVKESFTEMFAQHLKGATP